MLQLWFLLHIKVMLLGRKELLKRILQCTPSLHPKLCFWIVVRTDFYWSKRTWVKYEMKLRAYLWCSGYYAKQYSHIMLFNSFNIYKIPNIITLIFLKNSNLGRLTWWPKVTKLQNSNVSLVYLTPEPKYGLSKV